MTNDIAICNVGAGVDAPTLISPTALRSRFVHTHDCAHSFIHSSKQLMRMNFDSLAVTPHGIFRLRVECEATQKRHTGHCPPSDPLDKLN